jgi:hypothetical protein
MWENHSSAFGYLLSESTLAQEGYFFTQAHFFSEHPVARFLYLFFLQRTIPARVCWRACGVFASHFLARFAFLDALFCSPALLLHSSRGTYFLMGQFFLFSSSLHRNMRSTCFGVCLRTTKRFVLGPERAWREYGCGRGILRSHGKDGSLSILESCRNALLGRANEFFQ